MSALGKLADKFKSLREKNDKHNQDKGNVHEEKPSPDPGSSGYASFASEEDRPDKLQLTDAGQFSYVGVCALSLKELFSSHWHKSFRSQCLKRIIHHLELPQQVETSTFAFMEGHGADNTDLFIKVLEIEPALEEHGLVQVPQDLVTIALKDGCYDARMRVLIQHVAGLLRVEWEVVEQFEKTVVESLREEDHMPTEEEEKEKKNQEIKRKVKRYALVGLATVGFGTLIGLTGGLAAPMIAARAGAIVGGTGAAALGSAAGVAIIGSLFGVAGAGLGGYKMSKRVGALEEFGFETLTPGSQLHVTIAVSGWIKEEDPDFKTAWKSLDNCQEQYVLRFEPKYLIQMGQAMDYIISFAMSAAAQEALKYTIVSGLVAAVVWPVTLLSTACVIDNPWSVCSVRAATAGRQLAEVLLSRLQGKRPVTLIGFSLGARVIFTCLTEMARRTNCEGIVQDAILLGAPVTGNPKLWQLLERVVAGKIVNGYIMGDWFLKFVYRTASVQFTVAGLGPINWNSRQMRNVDLSDVVNGHMDYMKQMHLILKVIGVKVKEVDVLGEYVMVGTAAV